MTEFINSFEDHIPLADLEDFEVGDHVCYTKRLLGYFIDKAPLYLQDYDLIVAGKTKRKVICTCDAFPNEKWHIEPRHLKLNNMYYKYKKEKEGEDSQ